MIDLYVMSGGYVNTESELWKDGSDNEVKGHYQVNISDWEYQNEAGNYVDRVLKENCFDGKPLPAGYIKIRD